MARKPAGCLVWIVVLIVGAGIGNVVTRRDVPVVDRPEISPTIAASSSAPQSPASAPLFSSPAKPSVPAPSSTKPRVLYVTASSLNVRATPDPGGTVLLKAQRGTSVVAVSQIEGWYEVRLTNGATGWMSAAFLSDTAPTVIAPPSSSSAQAAAPPPTVVAAPKKPAYDRNAVVAAIISASIASYPSVCACPYSTMRNGRSCGRRSAYSKPGGYAPLCYPQDVSQAMIDEFVARR